eukprot:g3200.t1
MKLAMSALVWAFVLLQMTVAATLTIGGFGQAAVIMAMVMLTVVATMIAMPFLDYGDDDMDTADGIASMKNNNNNESKSAKKRKQRNNAKKRKQQQAQQQQQQQPEEAVDVSPTPPSTPPASPRQQPAKGPATASEQPQQPDPLDDVRRVERRQYYKQLRSTGSDTIQATPERRRGVISSHKESFGFIKVANGQPDFFFHVSELDPNHCYPLGAEVEFVVGKDMYTGRMLATKLMPIVAASGAPAFPSYSAVAAGKAAKAKQEAKAAEAAAAATAGGALPLASVGPAADGGYDKWNRFGDEPFRGFKNGASTRSWRGAAKAEGATTASTAAISSTYKPFHLRNGALPLPSAVAAGGMDCGFRTSKRW